MIIALGKTVSEFCYHITNNFNKYNNNIIWSHFIGLRVKNASTIKNKWIHFYVLSFIIDKITIFVDIIKYKRYGSISQTALFEQNREVS